MSGGNHFHEIFFHQSKEIFSFENNIKISSSVLTFIEGTVYTSALFTK